MMSAGRGHRIARWGNSLALRIPARLAREIDLREGCAVKFAIENDKLVVAPAGEPTPTYELAELVAAITPDNQHEDVSTGSAVGPEFA
jgi:antitoxin MazE